MLIKKKFGAIDSSIKSLIFRDNCNNPKVVVWSLAAHAAFSQDLNQYLLIFQNGKKNATKQIWRLPL